MGAFRSVVCWVCLPPGVAFCSVGAIATAVAGGTPASVHRWYTTFAWICAAFAGTRVRVHGRDRIEPGAAYVVVSNHESNWDPVCLAAGLPDLIMRFVAKSQLMRIPIFGQALRATGNVEVVRRRDAGDVRRIQATMQRRDAYVSMLFFAEGTRSRDGNFRDFKMGAFATAVQEGLPILPIAVAGTYAIWPPETFWFQRGPAVVEVGEPIPTDHLGYEDRAALRDQTREAVAKLRNRARERIRAQGFEPGGID